MYNIFTFIQNYINHNSNLTYNDLKNINNENNIDKLKNILSKEEYDTYLDIYQSDYNRLLKYQ